MNLFKIVFLFILSGCSTYDSKFICKEASGIPCEMLSRIDKRISENQCNLEEKKCCK